MMHERRQCPNASYEGRPCPQWEYDSPNFPIMQSYTWGHGGLGEEGRLVYECILGGGVVLPPDAATGNVHTECDIHVLLAGAGGDDHQAGRAHHATRIRCPWTWGKRQGGCTKRDH